MKNDRMIKKRDNPGACQLAARNVNDDFIPFTPTLAHELRNPLSNIVLSVECLKEVIGNDRIANGYLDIILRGTARINNIVNTLLNSPVDRHEIIDYPVHELLDEVLEMASDKIVLKGVVINKDYDPKGYSWLMSKPDMKIALSNIILNAVEAMSDGIGRLDIITKSMAAAGKFLIQIRDNGCGISRKHLNNIFKPYFTTKRGGVGIGLAAVSNILHSNHIGVSVESKEGFGTCFNLMFEKKNT